MFSYRHKALSTGKLKLLVFYVLYTPVFVNVVCTTSLNIVHIVQCCTALWNIVHFFQHYTSLYNIESVSYCTTLNNKVQYCTTLYYIVQP